MAKRQTKNDKREGLEQRRDLADWTAAGRPDKWKWKHATPPLDFFNKQVTELDKKNAAIEQKMVSEAVTNLQEEALALYKKDESNAHKLGTLLLDIKKLLPKGRFTKWCKKEGLEQSRVSYCMRVADPEGNKVKKANQRRKNDVRYKVLARYKNTIRDFWDAKEKRDLPTCVKLYEEIHAELLAWVQDAKRVPVAVKEKIKAAGAGA